MRGRAEFDTVPNQLLAIARGLCGAATFVHRIGDALNLNVHFHSLALYGVYAWSENGALRFHPPPLAPARRDDGFDSEAADQAPPRSR
ncbi:MAG: transposase [Proteobacteria bacterium]|nr:transposase [Pseudomonadota bacterium]